ncbi:peptidase S8 and S53 subtilisin kexin sedolisin [Nonomuraea aridisoli]|uniref:Peptidase S8 and S53 subtilisin kexin sedolisin n=1 Tax=Nonomuraea aridisoli TaxID=2070368 RepID=A0A2W2FKQ6_9ACTN|nr:peptidase S8 and S53 subtilisin kexin sedolisin [Nonomuraea aridisoli]
MSALAAVVALGACSSTTAQRPHDRVAEQSGTPSAQQAKSPGAGKGEYLVFYAPGKRDEAEAAVERAGGTRLSADTRLGYLMARAGGDDFPVDAGADPSVVGVSPDRRIGVAAGRPAGNAAFPDEGSFIERRGEPLAGRQWDMRMIGAERANAKVPGTKKVLVGVIDTGVDGKHPDIAPNFNRELSRNFVTDRPKDDKGETLDGPCEVSGCKDPVDADDDGHGTHVASTIASPINGIGIAGVAPGVQLVNIRAGQDSGFFFLKPSLDALAYAADIGVDVVNMSYFVDPWLFNCTDNSADTRKQQLEQRAIITGIQRAVDYARARGVTIVSALGNGSTDLGRPTVDRQSPGYPKGSEKTRRVDNSCLSVPAESRGVISVSSVGPSGRKAIYSDYGVEQTDVAAPGGDVLDGQGGAKVDRGILAAAPERVLRKAGRIDADGEPKGPDVVKSCKGGTCAYYQYLEGTSMAAPHATGVAAILISRFGKPGRGGVELAPATVEELLYRTATRKSCPSPREYVYKAYGQSVTHACEGDTADNGFYGHGIVNAWKAATVEP